MNFSYKMFENEFSISMKELEQAFAEKDFEKTLRYVRFLAKAYYQINYKFTDDRLEEILKQTAAALLGETRITDSKPETVVFYDGAGLADRGLADNYVSSLAKLGYQVTWIMHYNAPGLEKLQSQYREEDNITFCIVPQSSILERMRIIQSVIKEIAPRHIFLNLFPWDICGTAAVSTCKGEVTRFLIDMTDHAFWIGKLSTDYVIGFRESGYAVAHQFRHIPAEKIVILPYYPEKRARYPFEGMPFNLNDHEYIFSGGAPYKIEGDSDNTYQKMVEYILCNYPNLKFVYAGNGTNAILKFLKEKYSTQFYNLNERKDLDEVLKHAKLYLGTYPIGGGLMTQYAIENQCIPLCLCLEPAALTDVKTFLLQPDKWRFAFYQKDDLLRELDRLLNDDEYYENARRDLDDQVIKPEEFAEELQRLLTEHQTKFSKRDALVPMKNFLETYKQRADYQSFCELIFSSHNDWVKKRYPEIMKEMNAKKQNGTV